LAAVLLQEEEVDVAPVATPEAETDLPEADPVATPETLSKKIGIPQLTFRGIPSSGGGSCVFIHLPPLLFKVMN
jgi:hypothetical protein